MKRWIIAASAAVVAAVVAVLVVPGATGSTYAVWNRTATAGATVAAGTWAPTVTSPIYPSASTPTQVANITYRSASVLQVCADVVVTTASTTPIDWLLTIDTNAAPFWGNSTLSFDGTAVNVSGPVNGIIEIRGSRTDNSTITASSQPITVIICRYQKSGWLPAPVAAGASTYEVTNTIQQDGVRMCVVSVVAGREARYHVPWATTFNYKAMLAAAFGAGSTTYANYANRPLVSSQGTGGSFVIAPSGDQWTIRGDGWDTAGIIAPATKTISTCTAY